MADTDERLWHMRIRVNLQIFIFAIIFYLTQQIKIYTILMLFALVHELGHLLAGLCLVLKAKSIDIMPFGISINFEDYSNKYIIKKILIAIAGPLTNLIIVIFGVYNNWDEDIIYSNALIGMFNLIPLYPLDGGRILKYIIQLVSNVKEAEIMTYKLSNILIIILTIISSIGILFMKNIGIVLILAYLWMLVIKENKKYKLKMKIFKLISENTKALQT